MKLKLPYHGLLAFGRTSQRTKRSRGSTVEHFLGEQTDGVISVSIERIKATEFEVYIQEVKGAQYVSINLPKCKVKVVDDCQTYATYRR